MARVLLNQLVVGAKWETLIGLQREATEVRSLASSRQATHSAIADDASGTRTVGLFTLSPDTGVKPARSPELHALAAVIGGVVDAQHLAFVHPDPDDPQTCLLVALRDRRPAIDEVLPFAQAWSTLAAFLVEVAAPVKIVGDWSPPPRAGAADDALAPQNIVTMDGAITPEASSPGALQVDVAVPLALAEIAAHVQRERPSDGRLSPVRKPLPVKTLATVGVLLLGLGGVAGAGWFVWDWLEQTRRAEREAANRVNPVDDYRRKFARALAAESMQAGGAFARVVQRTVQTLPASAGGWRPASITCDAKRCEIQWQRQEGGTFDLLLSQRPYATIVDLNHATESIALQADAQGQDAANNGAADAATAPAVPAGAEDEADMGVTPIPMTQFLRSAGARLQQLGDYGMDISMSMAKPLVSAPVAISQRPDVPPPVSKGEWQMAGHLAFLDSVAGLMSRAGNMSLHELKVSVDDTKPVFTVRGFYYVH